MRTAMVAEALYIHSFNRHDTMKPILANLHIADAFCLQRLRSMLMNLGMIKRSARCLLHMSHHREAKPISNLLADLYQEASMP
jgi:hypothetical protein